MIPEDNILSSVQYSEFGVSAAYGNIIDYMMRQINEQIKQFMGTNLPPKATKYNTPHVLWVEPTLHTQYTNNDLRIKFIRSLHIASSSSSQQRMVVLPLRQNWDDTEKKYIQQNIRQLNPTGLLNYCRALDKTIKFAETKLMRNYGVPLHAIFQKEKTAERDGIKNILVREKSTESIFKPRKKIHDAAAATASTIPTGQAIL